MPTKNVPNPAAATSASPIAARLGRGRALLDRLARGEDHARQRDRHAGDLQPARPLALREPDEYGTAAAVAEIGATTLIVPIASAR